MQLLQTYQYKAHNISGAQIIERTGRKADERTPMRAKASKDVYSLKTECELNLTTDSINYFDRATLQRAARRNKRK